MSTILNTLKKLEEEKSVLDKGVDLKKLVLGGEGAAIPSQNRELQRKWLFFAVLVLAGVVLGILMMWFSGKADLPKASLPPSELQVRSLSPAEDGDRPGRQSHTGIPLANIQDETDPISDYETFDEVSEGEFENASPIPLEELKKPEFDEFPPEVVEINSLIRSATSAALEEPISSPVSTLRSVQIPGLRVKGIIFFEAGSPENYLIVTTGDTSSRKLKVGESVFEAVLKSIKPDKGIFFYQGDWVEVGIGG